MNIRRCKKCYSLMDFNKNEYTYYGRFYSPKKNARHRYYVIDETFIKKLYLAKSSFGYISIYYICKKCNHYISFDKIKLSK